MQAIPAKPVGDKLFGIFSGRCKQTFLACNSMAWLTGATAEDC